MGEEGFSSDSSLLYHRGVPSAIVDSQRLGARATSGSPPTTRSSRGTSGCTTSSTDGRGPACPVDGPAAGARQRRRPDRVRRHRDATPRRSTATRSVTSASSSRRAPAPSRPSSASLPYRAGDYVVVPRATDHRWVPAEPCRLYAIEANSHIAPAQALPRRASASCSSTRRTASATCTARPSRTSPRAPTSRCWSSTATSAGRRRQPADLRRPTPSTSSAGTAASTPTRSTSRTTCRSPARCTSRRRCTRSSRAGTSWSATSCRARSTTTRSRSRCPTTTPTSTPTRSCSTSAATTRRARARASTSARSALHPGGHAHGPQPSAIEASLGVDYFEESAVMVDTFKPLELGEGGAGGRGPGVRLDLGRARPDSRPGRPSRSGE